MQGQQQHSDIVSTEPQHSLIGQPIARRIKPLWLAGGSGGSLLTALNK